MKVNFVEKLLWEPADEKFCNKIIDDEVTKLQLATSSNDATAYHEAGHYFISNKVGGKPEFIMYDNTPAVVHETSCPESQLQISLAGVYAECRFFHNFTREKSMQTTFVCFAQCWDDEECLKAADLRIAFEATEEIANKTSKDKILVFAEAFSVIDDYFYRYKKEYEKCVEKAKAFFTPSNAPLSCNITPSLTA